MSYWCFFLEFSLIFLKTLTFTLNLYLMFHWLSSFHKRKSFSLTFSLFRWFIFSIPHSSSYLLFLSPEFLKKIIFSHFLEWLSWFFHSFSHFLSLSLSSDELLSEREGEGGHNDVVEAATRGSLQRVVIFEIGEWNFQGWLL